MILVLDIFKKSVYYWFFWKAIIIVFSSCTSKNIDLNVPLESNAKTILNFDQTEYDLNYLTINEKKKLKFCFSNTGKFPLTIYRITSSCDCDNIIYSKKKGGY